MLNSTIHQPKNVDELKRFRKSVNGWKMKKAVFIDRDGVICEEVDYLCRKEDLRLLPNVGEAIKLLNENKWLAIVISNQAVVARGMCTIPELEEINGYMGELLEKEGAKLDGIYYCPHHPTAGNNPEYTKECDCRKPKPGMIFLAAREIEIENLPECYMIGDKNSDIRAGIAAGCKTILVETGYGGEGGDGGEVVKPDYKARDLYDAVSEVILKNR